MFTNAVKNKYRIVGEEFIPISHGFEIEDKDLKWLSELADFHPTHDKQHAIKIANAIKKRGWDGPAILYSEYYDQLITGTHRKQAAKILLVEDEAINAKVVVPAINVDNYLDYYLEYFGLRIENLPYNHLRVLFEGTDLEKEVRKNTNEW